jgi:selenocysteine lyase/cysteine desulfurase
VREAFGQRFEVPVGYLNTASIGVPPVAVADAVDEAVTRWRTGQARAPEFDEHVAAARTAWARLAGVDSANVATGASVSQLVGLVAASLPAGSRVLVPENEFTSVSFPFAACGHRVTEVPHADFLSHVDGHDVVAISPVQSADGARFDLDALRAAARAAGARVLLDVTQTVGWLPVALDWADWVVCAGYKWLLAPRGAAWLACRPEHLERITPAVANWYAAEDPWTGIYGLPLRLAGSARRLDLSPVWFAQLGAAASVSWLAELDLVTVRAHCVGLADATLAALDLPPRGSAIISLDLTEAQAGRLADAGVVGAARAGRTRLSFHLYNTADDVDLVVGALR